MADWRGTILGIVAGICTTGSFVPQVIKAWREHDTGAISLRMYLVTTAGFCLWIGYGLLLGSWPIIIFNVIALVLGGIILWLKLREGKAHSSADSARARIGSGSAEQRRARAAEMRATDDRSLPIN